MKKRVSLFLIAIMLLSLISSAFAFSASAESTESSNWMSKVPDEVLLCNLNIPGTHDSAMFGSQWGTGRFAETQDLSIQEQLKAGARILDLRLRYGGEGELYLCHGDEDHCCDAYDGQWGALSGKVTYKKVLQTISAFLEENPGETVIATVQHEWKAPDVVDDDDDDIVSDFRSARITTEADYGDMILRFNPETDFIYTTKDKQTEQRYGISFTRELDGSITNFNYYTLGVNEPAQVPGSFKKNTDPLDDEMKEDFDYAISTLAKQAQSEGGDAKYGNQHLDMELIPESFAGFKRQRDCDITMGEARKKLILVEFGVGFGDLMESRFNNYDVWYEEKWTSILPFFSEAGVQDIHSDNITIRAAYSSCTGRYEHDENGNQVAHGITDWPHPEGQADVINPRILNYNILKGKHYGWLAMDYVSEDLCKKIYLSNNLSDEVIRYYISDIRGFCGDKKNNDAEDLKKTIKACEDAGYIVLSTNGITNVNTKGYNMVIGYKLTSNAKNAITDIYGTYGEDGSEGYTKVITKNSMYNYFTRGSGSDSENTYLYYKVGGGTPITALELIDSCGNVKKKGGGDFNLNEGLGITVGLNMVYEQAELSELPQSNAPTSEDIQGSASVLHEDASIIHIAVILAAAAVAVAILVIHKKKKRETR